MKVKDLIKIIEKDYPLNSAMDFDNPGANLVNNNDIIKGIVVSLDATLDTIEYAYKNGANLIITHHPLIFNSIKNINDDMLSLRLKQLMKYGINVYSIHTNFDVNIKAGMGKIFVEKLFKKTEILKHEYLEKFSSKYAIGDVITLKKSIKFIDLKDRIFKTFSVKQNEGSFYDYKKKDVKKIIILPGGGGSDTELVIKTGCDCYISSDLKHNNLVDLRDASISYINPTHYNMEKIFVPYIEKYLKKIRF